MVRPRNTTNCRIYPTDNGWLLKHRGIESTAAVIHRLIVFYERTKELLEREGPQ